MLREQTERVLRSEKVGMAVREYHLVWTLWPVVMGDSVFLSVCHSGRVKLRHSRFFVSGVELNEDDRLGLSGSVGMRRCIGVFC